MIWRRRRRRPSAEAVKVRRQLEQAIEDLEAARADDVVVDRVAEAIDRFNRRNHLGPMITEAMRGAR